MIRIHRHWMIPFILLLPVLVGGVWAQNRSIDGLEEKVETDKSRLLLREQMENLLGEYERQYQKLTGAAGTEDLGEQVLVKRKPKPWNLALYSDVGEMWSSNVLYVDTGTQADFALTHNDAATVTYRVTDKLTLSGNYRYSLYRYNRLISQNFDTHSAGGRLDYSLPWNLSAYSGLQWTTVYSSPVSDSVYEDADWSVGITRITPLNFATWMKDKASWFVGYQNDWRLASPYDYDKVEVGPFTGLSYAIEPNLVLQSYYRWQYQHFQHYGRKDYNNLLSGSVIWAPFSWMRVSAFCSWNNNNSVGSTRDYAVFNTGLSVSANWQF
jgi:hypothetical protein